MYLYKMWYFLRVTGHYEEDVNMQMFYENLFEYCSEHALCSEVGNKKMGRHTHCLFQSDMTEKQIKNMLNDYGFIGNKLFCNKVLKDESEKNLISTLSYILKEDAEASVQGEFLESSVESAREVGSEFRKKGRVSELDKFRDYIRGATVPQGFASAARFYYEKYAEYVGGRFEFREVGKRDWERTSDGTGGGFRATQCGMIVMTLLNETYEHRLSLIDLLLDRHLGIN